MRYDIVLGGNGEGEPGRGLDGRDKPLGKAWVSGKEVPLRSKGSQTTLVSRSGTRQEFRGLSGQPIGSVAASATMPSGPRSGTRQEFRGLSGQPSEALPLPLRCLQVHVAELAKSSEVFPASPSEALPLPLRCLQFHVAELAKSSEVPPATSAPYFAPPLRTVTGSLPGWAEHPDH